MVEGLEKKKKERGEKISWQSETATRSRKSKNIRKNTKRGLVKSYEKGKGF